MIGRVVHVRGTYVFLSAPGHNRYFAPGHEIEAGAELHVGDVVVFEPYLHPRGLRAERVRPLRTWGCPKCSEEVRAAVCPCGFEFDETMFTATRTGRGTV